MFSHNDTSLIVCRASFFLKEGGYISYLRKSIYYLNPKALG